MKKIVIPKEIKPEETRVAVVPATVKELIEKEFEIYIEQGAGLAAYISDAQYQEVGATIIDDVEKLYSIADLVLKVNAPLVNTKIGKHEADMIQEGAFFISFLQIEKESEVLHKFSQKNITAFAMDLIPRTTLAQKMDALSSQASIAGYEAVIIGATRISKYMPLLMTAAGTIPPARVLVLGAGVAGLQAIATAKRLGAQVEVFDVRSVAREAVESLGAKFIAVPTEVVEEMEEGGYAKETSEEYQKRQAELIERHIVKADLIITTALIPGKKAPVLISANMVQKMCPGAVIMDLAAENGGNCELTQPGKVIVVNKVIIDGSLNLPAKMSVHASKLYARNIINFVNHLFPKTVGANHKSPLSRIGQDEIITATVVQPKEG